MKALTWISILLVVGLAAYVFYRYYLTMNSTGLVPKEPETQLVNMT